MADSEAKRAWREANTTMVSLRMNLKTDGDILEAIEGKPKQAELKRLIRLGLEAERNGRN